MFQELVAKNSRIQNPDIPRALRSRAAHGRAAGQGGAGQDRTPTGRFAQETTGPLAPQGIEVSSEARTTEIRCEPMGEYNERLTTG